TGDLTWYETGEGACGWDNTASDHIVAISKDIFDSTEYATANPNSNPLCGRQVSITGVDGSQYTAKVVDRCVGCEEGDLDLSEDFFNTVTSNGNGRVSDITWTW
ncbi:plant expansin, partial [Delphinella strobiligena]